MEIKKFKPFDKIIVKSINGKWEVDFYSHFDCGMKKHRCVGNGWVSDNNILPYEGNEHLVGTTDEPEPEIRLEEGELVMAKTDNGNWVLAKYKEHSELPWNNIDVVFSNGSRVSVGRIVPFSDFNPQNMEETKKHILCVKNGRIIRYKG